MHQDYSEGYVYEEILEKQDKFPNERKSGEIIVNRLLKQKHFGPLEHVSITFNVGYFSHSVMQQARTHRIASFDVQSGRYTGERIIKAAMGEIDIEKVFYLRPVGDYTDRQGTKYTYTEKERKQHLSKLRLAAAEYARDVNEYGMSEEHARGLIPFDIRQHFVVTLNARALLHFFDMRMPLDAQLEIGQLCNLMYPHFCNWMPEVADWYTRNRKGKNQLAP